MVTDAPPIDVKLVDKIIDELPKSTRSAMAALPAILVRCLLLCSQAWIRKSEASSCLLFRVVNLDMLVSENVLILKSSYSTCWGSKGRFTRGLESQVTLRSIYAISAVESVEVQTYHFTWVASPKYGMDVTLL